MSILFAIQLFSNQLASIFSWFGSPSFAFWTTAICVLFAIRCAQEFCSTTPKLFNVFSFYALSWALLLPYYGDYVIKNDPVREIFPSFAAFISVYIGGMLRQIRPEDLQAKEEVGFIDYWSLILLGLFIAPELFPVPQECFSLPAYFHPPLACHVAATVSASAPTESWRIPSTFWSHVFNPIQRLVYLKTGMHVLEFGSFLWGSRIAVSN